MLEQYPDTQAVLLTSPTYDGVVSDIAAIAEIVHAHQIPLIVDEAHGAHFGFSERFPKRRFLMVRICVLKVCTRRYRHTHRRHCCIIGKIRGWIWNG